jgi:hypothetical protein
LKGQVLMTMEVVAVVVLAMAEARLARLALALALRRGTPLHALVNAPQMSLSTVHLAGVGMLTSVPASVNPAAVRTTSNGTQPAACAVEVAVLPQLGAQAQPFVPLAKYGTLHNANARACKCGVLVVAPPTHILVNAVTVVDAKRKLAALLCGGTPTHAAVNANISSLVLLDSNGTPTPVNALEAEAAQAVDVVAEVVAQLVNALILNNGTLASATVFAPIPNIAQIINIGTTKAVHVNVMNSIVIMDTLGTHIPVNAKAGVIPVR